MLRSRSLGFTLIEVLVALAIFAFALTAVTYTNMEYIRNVAYLKDKTAAHWVGMNVVSGVRLGLIELPRQNKALVNVAELFGKSWKWRMRAESATDPNTLRFRVDVGDEENESMTHVIGFVNLTELRQP